MVVAEVDSVVASKPIEQASVPGDGQPTRRRPGGTRLDGVDLTDELLELFDELINVMFCIKVATDADIVGEGHGGGGRYVHVNDAFVRRTGRRTKTEVVGHTAAELFLPDLAQRYDEQDAEVFGSGEPLHHILELIRNERGDLGWYVTTKTPVTQNGAVVALVSVSRDLDTPSDNSAAVEPMGRVVEYVTAHLSDKIRVDDLAELAECSPSQLERRMRKVFGISVTQFVLKRRIDVATRLLADTDDTIGQIAAATGFYDQADFTKRFVRLTNETPGSFRASLGSG